LYGVGDANFAFIAFSEVELPLYGVLGSTYEAWARLSLASQCVRGGFMLVRVLLVLIAVAILCGCGQASSSVDTQENKRGMEQANKTEAPQPASESTTRPSASAEGGVTVGKAIAEAELSPVGNSGTTGTAVFKEVGSIGVQVDLHVSGLSTKISNAVYYAQVHEGSCSDQRTGEGQNAQGGGSALALVRLDRLLSKEPRLQAHGGHEHGIPEEPSGSIEQPVSFGISADGTASVSSLLEGVEANRLTSGKPEYIHLHAVGSEDASELACGDLVVAGRRGSG
jgi:hypothetical protein